MMGEWSGAVRSVLRRQMMSRETLKAKRARSVTTSPELGTGCPFGREGLSCQTRLPMERTLYMYCIDGGGEITRQSETNRWVVRRVECSATNLAMR